MSESAEKPTGLVADANVLIDYAKSDKSVLALISDHIAPIYVPSPVFDEANQFSEADAAALNMAIVEPTLSQALEAQHGQGAPSFQDWLCFVVARDTGWSVLTSDKALRNECNRNGISCVWGLGVMGDLVAGGRLQAPRAMRVANKIASVNPYITQEILSRFRNSIGL